MAKRTSKKVCIELAYNDLYTDIVEHPNDIAGAWVKILCQIWSKGVKGGIEGTWLNISRIIGENEARTREILAYISEYKIADVNICQRKVKITCRRLEKEHKTREYNRLKKRESRAKVNCQEPVKKIVEQKPAQITVDNDPDLFPGIVPPEPTEQTGEVFNGYVFYCRIVKLWNGFAKKKASIHNIHTQSAVLQTCHGIGGAGERQFIEAIENYRKACEAPHSQAWPFNLHKFSVTGHRKFLPGVFDIDNYIKTNFKPQDDSKSTIKAAMDYE